MNPEKSYADNSGEELVPCDICGKLHQGIPGYYVRKTCQRHVAHAAWTKAIAAYAANPTEENRRAKYKAEKHLDAVSYVGD
jgi:hypothetical protein